MNINQLYTIFPEIILFDINIYLTIKSICIMDIITILYHISIWRQSMKNIYLHPHIIDKYSRNKSYFKINLHQTGKTIYIIHRINTKHI